MIESFVAKSVTSQPRSTKPTGGLVILKGTLAPYQRDDLDSHQTELTQRLLTTGAEGSSEEAIIDAWIGEQRGERRRRTLRQRIADRRAKIPH